MKFIGGIFPFIGFRKLPDEGMEVFEIEWFGMGIRLLERPLK